MYNKFFNHFGGIHPDIVDKGKGVLTLGPDSLPPHERMCQVRTTSVFTDWDM